MYLQLCVWPSVEWYLLIRHLLDHPSDSNCSWHFAHLPVEIEYALSPIPLLLSLGLVGQSRQNVSDCHEPGKDFVPSNVEDILRLKFRLIDAAPPNFATAKLQSECD